MQLSHFVLIVKQKVTKKKVLHFFFPLPNAKSTLFFSSQMLSFQAGDLLLQPCHSFANDKKKTTQTFIHVFFFQSNKICLNLSLRTVTHKCNAFSGCIKQSFYNFCQLFGMSVLLVSPLHCTVKYSASVICSTAYVQRTTFVWMTFPSLWSTIKCTVRTLSVQKSFFYQMHIWNKNSLPLRDRSQTVERFFATV